MTKNKLFTLIIAGTFLCAYNDAFSSNLEKEDLQQKRTMSSVPKERETEYFIKYHPGKKELNPGTKLELIETDIFKGKTIHYDGNKMWIEGRIFTESTQQ